MFVTVVPLFCLRFAHGIILKVMLKRLHAFKFSITMALIKCNAIFLLNIFGENENTASARCMSYLLIKTWKLT